MVLVDAGRGDLVAWWLGGLVAWWLGGLVVTWPEVAKDWESCSCCSPGARAEVGAAPAPQVQYNV